MDTIDAEKIRSLALAGSSQRDIARATGVSRYKVRAILAPQQRAKQVQKSAISLKGLSGRISSDRPQSIGFGGGFIDRALAATAGDAVGMDTLLLDANSVANLPIDKLIDIAVNASPEVSRALWDFLRLAVGGYEVEVFKPNTKQKEPDEYGQATLDTFRQGLKVIHGDESVIYRSMFISAWMRGAMIVELEMDDQGKYPVDIVTPDPAKFSFKLVDDHWKLGQYQKNEWVEMDRVTFRHVQIDPKPGKPEGRAPVTSAMFPAIFLLGLYQDLRRVIANQGYPRLDISVDSDRLQAMIEENVDNVGDFMEFIDSVMADVTGNVGRVGPGDAYAHLDLIKMNAPIGVLGGDLNGITSVIDGLERMLVRALKTDPMSMALGDSAGETNANRNWEQKIEGVKAIQQPAEILLETIYEMALQAFGVIADVKFRFATTRASEELRDAQTETIKLNNAAFKQDRGWLTPNEAAQEATGTVSKAVAIAYDEPDGSAATSKNPAPAPAPIAIPATIPVTTANDPAAPGSLALDGERRVKAFIPPAMPTHVMISKDDIDNAIENFDKTVPNLKGILRAKPL